MPGSSSGSLSRTRPEFKGLWLGGGGGKKGYVETSNVFYFTITNCLVLQSSYKVNRAEIMYLFSTRLHSNKTKFNSSRLPFIQNYLTLVSWSPIFCVYHVLENASEINAAFKQVLDSVAI